MKKITVNSKNFHFDNFTIAILNFHSSIAPEEVNPSTYIIEVDTDGCGDWGPDEGWNNFLQVLTQGSQVYFPFSVTNCDEPIECADGKSYEIDEDSDFSLSETETVGFLIGLDGVNFIIQSAICSSGDHPAGIFTEVTDCGIFDKPMKKFISKFINK